MRKVWIILLLGSAACVWGQARGGVERGAVEAGLKKAARFFREEVSMEGGYLWNYSADLKLQEGEEIAARTSVWVQPPGTPTVGLAFLRAWQVTGERYYLSAATAAGDCLVRGQLRGGGWSYEIPFDQGRRRQFDLRVDAPGKGKVRYRNSTLDDNVTQEALRFLVLLDEALEFNHEAIHEAAFYGLEALLAAQCPNGGFPHRFPPSPRYDEGQYAPKRACYPPEGEVPGYEKRTYGHFYTINDNLLCDINNLFFAAWEVYGERRYLEAARRVGEFIKLAQMPEPQPAWAQQYDFDMRPAWARRFEPASVTGGESQGIVTALAELFIVTGEARFLEPIAPALAYFQRSRLPDGRLARFYELRTNRPLYFNMLYELTYDDGDMPTHYAFKVPYRLDDTWLLGLSALGEEARLRERQSLAARRYRALGSRPKVSDKAVEQILGGMDARGAWVAPVIMKSAGGERVQGISCQRFVNNITRLCAWLEAHQNQAEER